ncbi:D-glycero-beta-D-manno-heptose 1,7-bisphosphate 7-phosphatase [Aestuariirhabdus litorea]|uniref:D,D-heptose 1,7-bisphosphate phosphatase n=1 Tax=Aestuariirhabdus litorea TaxID=2528527 RepID=A0A3P3VL35_9GAMM|nr:D-glycero-beta-D-manno-heptose 1,7-bisphosphate 7-phosphatase [Aestuariirhabdus litorea]RRJ82588.1 D-glycero-beta-D-manno-heptose 1,7-bisphosphate 7-phosphatase [Aestuariirhabdus litorea]RWW92747.1 D-glycero-beta-D-manno-heptose 1,7-bisphosphate 7-phosphatase [Endozoicomonadaceae bacterium GTF-13]
MALIILDRDGVINEDSDAYVKSLEEWIPIPGSIDAIARLSQAGHQVAIATNQSGLGRGLFPQSALDAMHQRLNQLVTSAGGCIAYIAYCPHAPEAGCQCRKPATGLIEQIEEVLGVSARGSYLVGDSLRDLQAGVSKGALPVLVRTGKGERTLGKGDPLLEQALVYDSLDAFTTDLLAKERL